MSRKFTALCVSDQGISGTNRAIEEDAVVTVGDWS